MANNKIMFSILIPNCGFSKSLLYCVTSVIPKNIVDFSYEIIICDQSDENDYKNNVSLLSHIKNVSFYHLSEKNVIKARYFLIDKAKGCYVIFLDSDDYVKPGYLEYLYNLLKDNTLDLIVLNHFVECGKKESLSMLPVDIKKSWREYFYYTGILNPVWKKVFRRALYNSEDYNDYSTINGDDWVVSMPIIEKCKSIYFSPCAFYCYTINSNGLSHCTTIEKAIRSITLKDKFINTSVLSLRELQMLTQTKINYFISFGISLFGNRNLGFKQFTYYAKVVRKNVYTELKLKNKYIKKIKTRFCGIALKSRFFLLIYLYILYSFKKGLKK